MNNPHKQTTLLYNCIYKNAKMGLGTTTHLLKGERGPEMEKELQLQNAEFAAFCRNSAKKIKENGGKVKGLSRMEELRTDSLVSLNLLYDRSDSHVAEMLMNGNSMGVIQALKTLKEYPQASEDSKNMMRRLADFEEQSFDKFKSYL